MRRSQYVRRDRTDRANVHGAGRVELATRTVDRCSYGWYERRGPGPWGSPVERLTFLLDRHLRRRARGADSHVLADCPLPRAHLGHPLFNTVPGWRQPWTSG